MILIIKDWLAEAGITTRDSWIGRNNKDGGYRESTCFSGGVVYGEVNNLWKRFNSFNNVLGMCNSQNF